MSEQIYWIVFDFVGAPNKMTSERLHIYTDTSVPKYLMQ